MTKYFLLGALLAGCGTAETPAPAADANTEVVAKALALRAEITKDPANGAAILAAHKMTRADLDAMMSEIAADPALSARFESAPH